MENMTYVATVNVPGYLPMMDNVEPFDSAYEAWKFLLDYRESDEDSHGDEFENHKNHNYEYSDTWKDLYYTVSALSKHIAPAGLNPNGTGTIHGSTPGSESFYDLGLNYTVSLEPVESDK